MAVGLIVLALGPSPAVAVCAAALLGFGFSFPWSPVASTVLKQTPQRERGSAVGVLSAFYDLFVGISSFAAGRRRQPLSSSVAFLWQWPAPSGRDCGAICIPGGPAEALLDPPLRSCKEA